MKPNYYSGDGSGGEPDDTLGQIILVLAIVCFVAVVVMMLVGMCAGV